MRRLCYLLFLALIFSPRITAQDFNYVHYDTKDGLAGSTVYDMCQDKDGFIWFATENGLSRYDGTHFRNFTVKDGLPDNEVLKIFADSKGRVWIGTFNKELCYYFQGKIYNKDNSDLIGKINLNSALLSICEDTEGNLMIGDMRELFEVFADGRVEDIGGTAVFKRHRFKKYYPSKNYFDKGFLIITTDSIFKYANNQLTFWLMDNETGSDKDLNLKRFADGSVVYTLFPDAILSQTYLGNNIIYVSTVNGTWAIDTVQNKPGTRFLEGKKVSYTINDSEGNIWFSTMGEGVYKLPSTETRTINFPKAGNTSNSEVFSLTSYGNQIVCGLGFSRAALLQHNLSSKILDYAAFTGYSPNNLSTNRLYCSKTLSNGGVILGFDAYLVKLDKNGNTIFSNELVAIKSVDEIDKDHILVGGYSNTCKVRNTDLKIIDVVWTGRCTKVLYSDKKYYIGTINGLFEVDENKTNKYLGDLHPALKRRITDMKAMPDGTIWISTNDNGILAYKHGQVIRTIQDNSGLSSNICKTLFLDKHFLWVGTNKGLNRVDLTDSNRSIVRYSVSDGLPSDIVNALYVKDSIVWVGSPAGLTYFNENKISHNSFCRLIPLSVSVSGQEMALSANYNIAYRNNNFRFEYVAISFKSAGAIVYHYKLSGLDTSWQQTRETVLDYPSLPPGDYRLQLYAVNKFGLKSATKEIAFSIAAPFWWKWWFYTAVIILVMLLTGWLVNRRNKILRKRLEEKNSFQKQFAIMEQQALQAQMNPHFIFNCLNSIQQYILTNDKQKANEYLTGFATLIRQTLDNSSKQSITISEEIRYLSSYLEMEQMRFGDNFCYFIEISDSVSPDFISIPALLLQPYVENALRHGIRYKQEGIGKVSICFLIENGMLSCQVEDNGVGRKKAAEFKSRQHIEYQSKGMSLTEKRIELLNKTGGKITVMVEDLENADGISTGTRVTVKVLV